MWINFVSWAGRLWAAVESCRPGHVLSQSASLTPVRRNVYLGLRSSLTAVNVTGLGGGYWGMDGHIRECTSGEVIAACHVQGFTRIKNQDVASF